MTLSEIREDFFGRHTALAADAKHQRSDVHVEVYLSESGTDTFISLIRIISGLLVTRRE